MAKIHTYKYQHIPLTDIPVSYELVHNKKYNVDYVNCLKSRKSCSDEKKLKAHCFYVSSGKVDPKNSLFFYPNDSYYKKIAPDQKPILNTDITKDPNTVCFVKTHNFKSIGSYLVVKKIAEDLSLEEILENVYKDIYKQLLDCVFYFLHSHANVVNGIDTFISDTISFSSGLLDDSMLSRIFSQMTDEDRVVFFRLWKERFKGEFVAIDVTSLSSYSRQNIFQFGYNRDDDGLPQINVMVVFSTTSKLPVYYDIYDGSINDKTGFLKVLSHLKDIGFDIDKTFFIMDRGFYSKQNVETLLELKIKFLIAVTSTYIHVQEKIKEIGDISSGRKYIIAAKNDFCFGSSTPYGVYDGKINLFLFKTLERRKTDEIKLNQKLERIENVLSQNRKLDQLDDMKIFYEDVNEELTKSDYKFALAYYDFKLDKEKNVVEYKLNEKKLDELSNSFGYFTFISNAVEKEPKEVLSLYKFRSRSEQAFDSLKCDLDNGKIRTHTEMTRRGKLFVSFLTLICKCYIENKIYEHQEKYEKEKEAGKSSLTNLEKKTPSQLLRDLSLLRTTDAYTKKDFELEYDPSKMQNTMLELFNIDKEYVKTTLKGLSKNNEKDIPL